MGTLVNVTPKPATYQAFELQQPSDMTQVLVHIAAYTSNAYSGSVSVANSAGTLTWTLLINNQTNNSSAFATLNDYVILANDTGSSGNVSVCKAADYTSQYQ